MFLASIMAALALLVGVASHGGQVAAQAPSGGGGDAFTIIATPTGTNPVADSATDTLSFSQGNGISIVGSAPTDSVSITLDILTTGVDADSVQISSDSGFEFIGGDLTLLRGCFDDGIIGWDEATDEWVCGLNNQFRTIDAQSGTDPIAESPTDVLIVTGGNGATTTGDATTDTITIDTDIMGNAEGTDGDSVTGSADSGLEFVTVAGEETLTLLRGCLDLQILEWREGSDDWRCSPNFDFNFFEVPLGDTTISAGLGEDTLTFTSINATLDITGTAATDTIDFGIASGGVTTTEIADGTIDEVDLSANDAPADEECLTFETTGPGDFEWESCNRSMLFQPTAGSNGGQLNQVNTGHPVVLLNAAGEIAHTVVTFPADLATIVSLEILVIPTATQAAADWNIQVQCQAVGEAAGFHSNTDSTTTYNVTNQQFFAIDAIGIIVAAGCTPGDHGAILVQQGTAGHNVDVVSVELVWH